MDLYRHYKITLGEDKAASCLGQIEYSFWRLSVWQAKVQPVLGTISKKVGELSTFPEPFQFREVRQVP